MNNAYMIRNDGKAIPVSVHLYGSFEDIDETLYAAEWLYNNTKSEKTKELILSLIHSWIVDIANVDSDSVESLLQAINYEINDRPYKFLSENFVKNHIHEIADADAIADVDSLNKIVTEELNQEFLRVRIGGMYDTSRGNRDIYFRISSTNFNWFDIIWRFVYENKNSIDTVTVCADEESTGKRDYYYQHNGDVINRMPVEDFINLSGKPVFESINHDKFVMFNGLNKGYSIVESLPRANLVRVFDRYTMIRDKMIPYSF